MAPEISRALQRVTFVLLALAVLAVEVAAVDTRPVGQSFGLAAGWIVAAAVLARVRGPADLSRQADWHKPPGWVYLLVLALAAAPFAVEPLRRAVTGDGYPLELQMVFGLRNVGLGLAACAGWVLCLRLACVVSLFLVLFAAAMTNHSAVLVILGLYTAVGSVWLMLAYWGGLRSVLVAAGSETSVEVQARSERLPWVSLFVTVGLVGVVLGLIAIGPARAARTLGEWMPTSGGTGDYDPFARSGVNDGDEETSGDNAQSTGTTRADSFLNSPLPSLYDVVSDLYGPPCKSHAHERAIALETDKAREAGARPPDSLRPNREFPTARQGSQKPNAPKDRLARAIFEVEGRAPLHVRVVAFDRFDGQAWHEAPMTGPRALIEKEPDSNWMRIDGRVAPVFARPEVYTFKLTAPEGSFVPSPPNLARFRIGRVNRADFFGWGQDRVLKFAERKAPSGISVETERRTVDPRKLREIEFPEPLRCERFDYDALPPDLDPRVPALVREWTADRPRGWPQIAAVVARLRADYTPDRAYPTPNDCTDPLAHFLFDSKCGADYQFASAAAVLLRALGYTTRLVSGFYVHPDHYDPETRHTPVVKEDLHFWTEVMLPGGDWLVIEPTPGYEVPGPNLPLSERISEVVRVAADWVIAHALALGFGLLVALGGWIRRRELLDALAVRRWRWFPARTWAEQVRGAVRVLERRGRWAGNARPAGRSAPAWLRTTAQGDAELVRLAQLAEWAYYAPETPPPWPAGDARAGCRAALDTWTLKRWRTRPPLAENSPC